MCICNHNKSEHVNSVGSCTERVRVEHDGSEVYVGCYCDSFKEAPLGSRQLQFEFSVVDVKTVVDNQVVPPTFSPR